MISSNSPSRAGRRTRAGIAGPCRQAREHVVPEGQDLGIKRLEQGEPP